MNIKSLLLGSTLAITSLFTGVSAQAETCFSFGPGVLCNEYEYSNRYGQVYSLGYVNGSEREGMIVTCNNRNLVAWESRGNLLQGQAQWVAEEFCSLPNN